MPRLVGIVLAVLALGGMLAAVVGAQAPPPEPPPEPPPSDQPPIPGGEPPPPGTPPPPPPPKRLPPPSTLLVAPATARTGDTVLVRGVNFPRRKPAVVTANGQRMLDSATNPEGGFATGFIVPPGPPRTISIVADVAGKRVGTAIRTGGAPRGSVFATSRGATMFTSLTLTPPGARVRVRARGLPPSRPVSILVSETQIAKGKSTAGGNFTRTVRIPDLGVGRRGLRVVSGRLELLSYVDIRPPKPRRRPPGSQTLVATGDIACPAAERTTRTRCRHEEVADLTTELNPTIVAPLGDNQYERGTLLSYVSSFDRTWGHLKARMKPAIGNHEYRTPDAAGYYTYFGAVANPPRGYYAYQLGAWKVIVLNSNCYFVLCGAGSAQDNWLRAQLRGSPRCTLVYFHHPRFFSKGPKIDHALVDLWRTMRQGGVEVVLNGHLHSYERFAPQNETGHADPAGIRQITVGTGGSDLHSFDAPRPNSQKRLKMFGVVEMTLWPGRYRWRFHRLPDGTIEDAGTNACH